MKEKLISKATAKLAKEKGFNVPTFTNYCLSSYGTLRLFYGEEISLKPSNNHHESWSVKYELCNHNRNKKHDIYSAPSQSLLQKWLREIHHLTINVSWVYSGNSTGIAWYFNVKGIKLRDNNVLPHNELRFETFEDALETALQEALKLIP